MKNKIASLLIFILTFVVFCSCATKTKVEYVDREVVKYQKEFVHDTLVQHTHDSVYHTVFQKGDTIYDTKYVERIKWRDRVVYKTDTCYRDSVYTQIKEKTIEKIKYPKIFGISLIFSIICCIFVVVKIIRYVQIH